MHELWGPDDIAFIIDGLPLVRRFVGLRAHGGWHLTADERQVTPERSQRVWNHSPDGFAWGYCGSGPAQLALAILLEAGLTGDLAVALHQTFKQQLVARWDPEKNWILSGEDVRAWIESALGAEGQRQMDQWREDANDA